MTDKEFNSIIVGDIVIHAPSSSAYKIMRVIGRGYFDVMVVNHRAMKVGQIITEAHVNYPHYILKRRSMFLCQSGFSVPEKYYVS